MALLKLNGKLHFINVRDIELAEVGAGRFEVTYDNDRTFCVSGGTKAGAPSRRKPRQQQQPASISVLRDDDDDENEDDKNDGADDDDEGGGGNWGIVPPRLLIFPVSFTGDISANILSGWWADSAGGIHSSCWIRRPTLYHRRPSSSSPTEATGSEGKVLAGDGEIGGKYYLARGTM